MTLLWEILQSFGQDDTSIGRSFRASIGGASLRMTASLKAARDA
jgi:hypothetical protein